MANRLPNVGQELLNVPLPEMVKSLALGIAEAQSALDHNSANTAMVLSTTMVTLPGIPTPGDPNANPPVPAVPSPAPPVDFPLIGLGFFPTFYQFAEANIEVKIAISMAISREVKLDVGVKAKYGCVAASVNASYSSKFDYKVEGSSVLKVRLAPVPPPKQLQDYFEKYLASFGG